MFSPESTVLIGRDEELSRLDAFLTDVSGGGAAVFITGDAGIGKSRLLRAAASRATDRGLRVLDVAGVQFEADLPYATLNGLLLPLLGRLSELDQPLREALEVALGLGDGVPPNSLLVCNAALALAKVEARDAPVLLIVDDLQWVDPASSQVIQLISRRLDGSHVGVLSSYRTEAEDVGSFPGVSVLNLEALSRDESERLLAVNRPELPQPHRRGYVDEAAGNPLALLELADATESVPDPHRRTSRVLPLSARLAAVYTQRIAALPEETRKSLLLLALDGRSEVRSLHSLGLSLEALAPAEEARLVQVNPATLAVRFVHPLTRSAVVERATSGEMREAHLLLADVVSDDPDRRAWHRAEASIAPDESIAVELEEVARRSLSRGDIPAGIAALIRAARLSVERQAEGRRLAEAAYLGADIVGEHDVAARLLADARQARPDTTSLHEAAASAYILIESDGDVDSAFRLITNAIDTDDHDWSSEDAALTAALAALLLICSWSGRPEHWARFDDYLAQFVPSAPEMILVERYTYGDTVHGGAHYHDRLVSLISAQRTESDPRRVFRTGTSAVYMDLLAECRPADRRQYEDHKRSGAVRASVIAAIHLWLDAFNSGRWGEAEEISSEALQICESRGYHFTTWYFLLERGLVAAARGDSHAAFEWADRLTSLAASRNATNVERIAQHIRTLASIGAGDWEGAYRYASAMNPPGDFLPFVPHALWVTFDLVEAAVRTGRPREAQTHVKAMIAAHVPSISPRMRMLTLAAQALVEDSHAAFDLFEAALAVPGAEAWPFEKARIHLALGERLRRSLESARARDHLREALAVFDRLGAAPWAERSREELRAARAPESRTDRQIGLTALTPQEQAIAQLAASGLSNKEIGRRLFLSPRTVSGHLYRVFPKLGVTSRAALRDALGDAPTD